MDKTVNASECGANESVAENALRGAAVGRVEESVLGSACLEESLIECEANSSGPDKCAGCDAADCSACDVANDCSCDRSRGYLEEEILVEDTPCECCASPCECGGENVASGGLNEEVLSDESQEVPYIAEESLESEASEADDIVEEITEQAVEEVVGEIAEEQVEDQPEEVEEPIEESAEEVVQPAEEPAEEADQPTEEPVEEQPTEEPEQPAEEIAPAIAEELVRDEISASEVDSVMTDADAAALIEDVGGAVHSGKKGIINIDTLSLSFEAGQTVTIEALKEKKLIDKKVGQVKVLARGRLDKPLIVELQDYSIEAAKMILITGGRVRKN